PPPTPLYPLSLHDALPISATRSPVPVRWTSIEINRGPAPARNLAWRMAEGEWIAFTDDDCRPATDWLVQLLKTADEAQAEVVQRSEEHTSELQSPYDLVCR